MDWASCLGAARPKFQGERARQFSAASLDRLLRELGEDDRWP